MRICKRKTSSDSMSSTTSVTHTHTHTHPQRRALGFDFRIWPVILMFAWTVDGITTAMGPPPSTTNQSLTCCASRSGSADSQWHSPIPKAADPATRAVSASGDVSCRLSSVMVRSTCCMQRDQRASGHDETIARRVRTARGAAWPWRSSPKLASPS